MSVRKTILLRKIISYFATPSQIARYDELSIVNKGSSSHFAFRLLEDYFETKVHGGNPESHKENGEQIKKGLKINGYGKTWYQ